MELIGPEYTYSSPLWYPLLGAGVDPIFRGNICCLVCWGEYYECVVSSKETAAPISLSMTDLLSPLPFNKFLSEEWLLLGLIRR